MGDQLLDLIPEGRKNAVSSRKFMELLNCSERKLRSMISTIRKEGRFVCFCNQGFFFHANEQELSQTFQTLERKAKGIFESLKSARRELRQTKGQQKRRL